MKNKAIKGSKDRKTKSPKNSKPKVDFFYNKSAGLIAL
jgi:hypothetical protein